MTPKYSFLPDVNKATLGYTQIIVGIFAILGYNMHIKLCNYNFESLKLRRIDYGSILYPMLNC